MFTLLNKTKEKIEPSTEEIMYDNIIENIEYIKRKMELNQAAFNVLCEQDLLEANILEYKALKIQYNHYYKLARGKYPQMNHIVAEVSNV